MFRIHSTSYMMVKLFTALLLFLGVSISPTNATTTIYATDFSIDPGWTTDQPDNFYWDASQEALFVHSQNKGPAYVPNRHIYTPTALDPTQPFLLSWDFKPTNIGENSWLPFGLFNASLSTATNTVHLAYHENGHRYGLITNHGYRRSVTVFYPDFAAKVGTWYHNVIRYILPHDNIPYGLVSYDITERDTGKKVISLAPAVEINPFSVKMSYLGAINYPYENNSYPDAAYEGYIDNIVLEGTATTSPPAECCSSVAFIPGLQATRLDLDGNRLWEPNRNLDVETLFLDDDGNSLTSDVSTDGIIDEAFGFNIYKNFVSFMDELVATGTIEEWKPFPYDWRFGPEDIIERDVLLMDGSAYRMYDEFLRLAEDSPTGKARIIANSNGGLVAKALISKLEAEGKVNIVDKLILVAAPQLGTPKAIAGILHGDEQAIPSKLGILLTKETARELAENMPSAYTLLPSEKYFKDVLDPVIEFDEDVSEIYDFPALYGDAIDSRQELDSFLLGDNGTRTEPSGFNTDEPNVLGENLLRSATNTQDKLDAWVPPADIKVIQIAGWGLDTIRGIRYDDCDILLCPDNLSNLDRELLLVHDGDGTVVIPSAVAMEGVESYYVNLPDNNIFLKRNRDHADIMEVLSLRNLIKGLLINDIADLPDFVSTEKPTPKDEDKKLRFRIHSPVSLDLYSEGNHTGLIENQNFDGLQGIEQQIPNSYYLEFGETKYAGADTFATTPVVFAGEANGTFTLEIDEVLGDAVVASTTFADIPVITGTRITTDIQHIASSTTLSLDMDNDGVVDAIIEPGEGISIDELLGILRGMVRSLDLADKQEKKLLKNIDKLEKTLEKEFKNEKKEKMKTDKVFEKLEKIIEKVVKKGGISKDDAQELIHIIEQIKGGVVG